MQVWIFVSVFENADVQIQIKSGKQESLEAFRGNLTQRIFIQLKVELKTETKDDETTQRFVIEVAIIIMLER
jgi:hypothetical protein